MASSRLGTAGPHTSWPSPGHPRCTRYYCTPTLASKCVWMHENKLFCKYVNGGATLATLARSILSTATVNYPTIHVFTVDGVKYSVLSARHNKQQWLMAKHDTTSHHYIINLLYSFYNLVFCMTCTNNTKLATRQCCKYLLFIEINKYN